MIKAVIGMELESKPIFISFLGTVFAFALSFIGMLASRYLSIQDIYFGPHVKKKNVCKGISGSK
jgi:hypothetical protein